MRSVRLLGLGAAIVLLVGCESARLRKPADAAAGLDAADPPPPPDMAMLDAAVNDAGPSLDAGEMPDVAPVPDAAIDAAPDRDTATPDAGPPDAGTGCNPADTVVPDPPMLLAPWNGATWGSAFAPSTLRPRLRWRDTMRACTYEVQLDRSCEPLAFATCDHGGDTPFATTDALEHTPTAALPVRTMAPVGDRYYWRVRACNGVGCSAWSPTRYLDVGRLPDDFDGDGDSEAVIGCPECQTVDGVVGSVFVYDGGATLDTTPLRIDHPENQSYSRFGAAVSTGDIDADGFGDLVIGGWTVTTTVASAGAMYVAFGSPSGLLTAPADIVRILSDHVVADGHFAAALAVVGDVDADGDRDVAIGAPNESAVHLALGTPDGIDPSAAATLDPGVLTGSGYIGGSVASAGDLDGDGIVDLIVGDASHRTASGLGEAGRVLVWRGSAAGRLGAATAFTRAPPTAGELFGQSVAGGFDLDDDGLSDVLIGADSRGGAGVGNVHVAYGSEDALLVPGPFCSDRTLVGGAMLGWNVSAPGDVDGDGSIDLFATAPALYALGNAGHVYRIRAAGPPRDRLACDPVSTDPDDGEVAFGYGLGGGDFEGDGDADLLVGAAGSIGDGRPLVNERAWILPGGGPTFAAPVEIIPPYTMASTYGFGRAAD